MRNTKVIPIRFTVPDWERVRSTCISRQITVAEYVRSLIARDIGLGTTKLRTYTRRDNDEPGADPLDSYVRDEPPTTPAIDPLADPLAGEN